MQKTAEEAYELVTETLDGQLSDSLIDRSCLEAMQEDAEKFGGEFMQKYAELTTIAADIKTAYRCSLMKKQYPFILKAVCGTKELEKEAVAMASAEGTDAVFSMLENSIYSDSAALLKESPAKFEKWCDDIIIDPLAAYYIAKEAEIKDIRILTVCKESGTDNTAITERMRKLYV